jgi:transcription factor-like protein
MAEDCIINSVSVQVITNFGSSKADLNLKYRLGLEHALAQADFLEKPDIILVQAFAIFLFLVRRHDSPRYAWMMTGLVIRMAQYLGLQRDGSHFDHLTPYEIELRRKLWWALCMLDSRASEDQGTEPSISTGSFDTKIPLNINVADLDPETKQMPVERDGVTDMTFMRIYCGIEDSMRGMIARGLMDGSANLKHKSDLLNEIYQKFEQGYLQYSTKSDNIAFWVSVTIARLVMAKMTLIVFLPVLFSSSSDHFSNEIRTKLLISAIEVAEYNHALNAEQACRQWRWIYQTYTHWHAIVYLLMEICRRDWSPMVERAWVALHSSWLIPAKTPTDKNVHIWVPLRKLMAKARKHRDAELKRLRVNPQAAARLEMEDRKMPLPSSSGLLPEESVVEFFGKQWRQLVGLTEKARDSTQSASGVSSARVADSTNPLLTPSFPDSGNLMSNTDFGPMYLATGGQSASRPFENTKIRDLEQGTLMNPQNVLEFGQTGEPSYNTYPTLSVDTTSGSSSIPWLWDDADPSTDVSWLGVDSLDVNMDLESEVNWYNWVESAKGME